MTTVETEYKNRIEDVLMEMSPTDSDVFVNHYKTSPRWRAGWIDNPLEPDLCFIESHDCPETLIRMLKKERSKRNHQTEH